MAQRQSWDEKIMRDAKLAIRNASSALEQAKADVSARGQTLMRQVQQRVEASAAQLSEGLATSQQAQRAGLRAIVPKGRPKPAPVPPIRKPVTKTSPTGPGKRAPVVSSDPTKGGELFGKAIEGAMQVDAAVRGAADVLTFGYADEIAAGTNALFDFDGRSFGDKYAEYHSAELARDQYDADHRSTARGVGQALGFGLSLVGSSAASAARAAGPKLLSEMRGLKNVLNTPRLQTSAREYVLATGGAGLLNGATQSTIDAATGGHGTVGDFSGAVVGGMVAAPFAIAKSPRPAGAVEGFTTSIAQDIFNGRPVALDKAMRTGAAGATASDIADNIGTRWAKNLSPRDKGKLGEQLSMIKTRMRGGVPNGRGQRLYLSKGYTVLDPASSADELAESKFGEFAAASNNQVRASQEHPNYRFDWWLPSDIGKMSGFGGSSFGTHLADDDR